MGFRDKSYAIPFYAMALNFAWDLLYTYHGFRHKRLMRRIFSMPPGLTFESYLYRTSSLEDRTFVYRRLGEGDSRSKRRRSTPREMLARGSARRQHSKSAFGGDGVFSGW